LAAFLQGCIPITMIRTVKLLGKQDPGAWKSFTILCILSELVVAVFNVPLLLFGENISTIVSNDPDVQKWFGKIIWVLVLHSQIRIGAANAGVVLIPMGKAVLRIVINITCFYLIATPVTAIIALTDIVTRSVILKLKICLATTAITSVHIGMFEFAYLGLMDWNKVAKVIRDRANTDIEQSTLS